MMLSTLLCRQFTHKTGRYSGTVTTFWFQAIKNGKYEIACSALCGMGHTNMRGFLTVESREDFDRWLNKLKSELAAPEDDFWSAGNTPGGVLTNWGWKWQTKLQ